MDLEINEPNPSNSFVKDQNWRRKHTDLEKHNKYIMDPWYPHHVWLHYSRYKDDNYRAYISAKEDNKY